MATKKTTQLRDTSSLRSWEKLRSSMSKESKVMVAAVNQVSRTGIDRLTVSAILAEAGVARGTVYAHFGDAVGVAATVWSHFGDQWLRDVLETAGPVLPASRDRIFVECLALARREPQLAEVVRPDIEALWSRVEVGGETARLRTVWTLATVIGGEILRPVDKNLALVGTIATLAANYEAPTTSSALDHDDAPRELPLAVISPFTSSDDPVTDRLIRGAVEVVASAGYENASTLRIARSAKLTPGAVAPRFDSLLDLHALTLETASKEVVEINMAQLAPWIGKIPVADLNAMLVMPALDETRRTWRAYRNELAIASLGNPPVARMVSRSFARSNEVFARYVSDMVGPKAVEPAVVFNEVVAVGLSVLSDVGIPLSGIDHRLMIRHLYAELIGDPSALP